MKAIVCKSWGGPSALSYQDLPSPALGTGQVRVAVHACGVNFADTLMIQGLYQVKPPFPFSPGFEAAGEVIEVSEGVTHLKAGDRVIALGEYGGFAEEIVVPAAMVLPIPENMEMVTAAGFAVAYGTSHLALAHRANLQAGETLLVFGSAGGVGLTAVEIGKLMGATVISCASSEEKQQLALRYGADHVMGYGEVRDQVKEITKGKGANVVYDPVGGDAFDAGMKVIAWEGRLLVIGFAGGKIPQVGVNMTLVKNCSIVGVYWGAYALNRPQVLRQSLETLLKWYAEGKLKPHISETFRLPDAPQALSILMERKSTGKVVVKVR